MKKIFFISLMVILSFYIGAYGVNADTLDNQTTILEPGWNIISTPRIVDHHVFSVAETSSNFSIFVLDSSKAAGWATMGEIGQQEFTPLYGYFINNKTASSTTLSLYYATSTSPNQRIFERSFGAQGWHSIGTANPTYVRRICDSSSVDTNNISPTLYSLNGSYSYVLDFTDESSLVNPNSPVVGSVWKMVTAGDANSLHDLRELKGYAVYIGSSSARLTGYQNTDSPQICEPINNVGDIRVDDQSVAGLTYATITSASGNIEVGDQQKEVAKFSFQQANAKEAVQLEALTVYVEGTFQESTDLSNWKLYSQEGSVLASADKAVERYVTFYLATPYVIDKGVTKYLSVKVDITDGSGRYFRAQIQNNYDVKVKGVTTGVYVAPTDSSGTAFDTADAVSATAGFMIKQGALTVAKSASSPSGSVSPAANNIVLARFDITATGEKFEIMQMHLGIDYASGYQQLTGTVSVKDSNSGEVYASISSDMTSLQGGLFSAGTGSYSSVAQVSLSNYITIESGQTKTIEILGSTLSTATATANYTVFVGGFYGKRYITNDYITLPNATTLYGANTLSVFAVGLDVTKDVSFADANRAPGSQNVKIAQFVLQASASDDVKVTGVNLSLTNKENVQNMYVKIGGTQFGSTVGTPANTANSYSGSATVVKSQSALLEVYGNFLSTASGSGSGGTTDVSVADAGITGYGIASSKALADTPDGAVAGQSMTVAAAALAIKKDAGAPTSKILLSGQNGVELNKINLEATNEDLTLKRISLSFVSANDGIWTVETGIPAKVSTLYLFDGSTLLGSASLVNGIAKISGMNLPLVKDQTKVLTVKADLTASNNVANSAVGAVKVYCSTNASCPNSSDLEVYKSSGLMTSGVTLIDNAQGNYMLFTDTAPAITNAYTATAGTKGATEVVAKYIVNNPGSRVLTVTDIRMKATMTGASGTAGGGFDNYVKSFGLYDEAGSTLSATGAMYSDPNFSSSVTELSAVTPVVYIDFNPVTYGAADQEVAANGGSRTFVIKADTTYVDTGLLTTSLRPTLRTEILGSKGYSAGNTTSEYEWNDGYITYSYTPVGGTTITGRNASDSVPVYGTSITF